MMCDSKTSGTEIMHQIPNAIPVSFSTLPREIRLKIYELLLPSGPWSGSKYVVKSFDAFFNLYHIDKEIRSEAQELFKRELQNICFEVKIDRWGETDFPKRPFDIGLIKVLSIEIYSRALGKSMDVLNDYEEYRELLQIPGYYYPEQNIVGTAMIVLELVKHLQSAVSLTQLSVIFLVEGVEKFNQQDSIGGKYSRLTTTLSMMKTLADPFKILHGINQPRLVGIRLLTDPWKSRVKVPLLDESNGAFCHYKTSWEKTLARPKHSPGLSDAEKTYYQLLQNHENTSKATSRLGSVSTSWEWSYRHNYGKLIYDDYLEDVLRRHIDTVSHLLGNARWARDVGNTNYLQKIDKKIVASFRNLVSQGDDLIQKWIMKRKEAVEYQCSKRQKLGADSFTI